MKTDSLEIYTETASDALPSPNANSSDNYLQFSLGLIVLIVLFVYRERIINYVWNSYIKIASKMGRAQASKVFLRELMDKHDYEAVIIKAEEILRNPDLVKEDIEEINSILQSAKYRFYDYSLLDIMNLIETDVDSAEARLVLIREQININDFVKKPDLELRCKNVAHGIETQKYKRVRTALLDFINSNDTVNATSSFISIHETYCDLNLGDVDMAFNKFIKKLIKDYSLSNNYHEISKLINILNGYTRIRKSSLFSESVEALYESLRVSIKNNSIFRLDSYKSFLSEEQNNTLDSDLKAHKQMVEKQLREITAKAIKLANSKEYVNAYSFIKRGEDLCGHSLDDERAQIEEIKKRHYQNEQQSIYNNLIKSANEAIRKGDENKALRIIADAEANIVAKKSDIDILKDLVKNIETQKAIEKSYYGSFPISVVPPFNVPKKHDKGEDSDPISDAMENRCWGIIGVFDGLGGAGGRRYKHKETQEEHTSAYWASRIVRQTVSEMMQHRPIGENPVKFFETNIRNSIVEALDREIENFPAATIKAPSKLIRRFPTTMAVSLYFIHEDIVDIYSYWAGDSRIYLFNKDTQFYLTIDDSDAPNNDPFAPENSDLAMNNAICQDKDKPFRINKSKKSFRLDENNPLIIMAATDGCFGYYTNPIEFEEMIRLMLKNGSSLQEWSDNIKQAIIDNIQQDDFSMSMVVLGTSPKSFTHLKSSLLPRLDTSIFSEYHQWLNNYKSELTRYNSQLEEITDSYSREGISEAEKEELNKKYEKLEGEMLQYKLNSESTNSTLYLKYKKTIKIIESSNIM